MGLTLFHEIVLYNFHIHTECEKYKEIFHGILSLPQNNIVDLNYNVMSRYFKRNVGVRGVFFLKYVDFVCRFFIKISSHMF